jgi:hypothetical protein
MNGRMILQRRKFTRIVSQIRNNMRIKKTGITRDKGQHSRPTPKPENTIELQNIIKTSWTLS